MHQEGADGGFSYARISAYGGDEGWVWKQMREELTCYYHDTSGEIWYVVFRPFGLGDEEELGG